MITNHPHHNQFDPIDFLNLQSLSPSQKSQCREAILADMTAYLIDKFVESLDAEKQKDFLSKLELISSNPKAITTLMDKTNPNFSSQKIKLLQKYREDFKLQKFVTYL